MNPRTFRAISGNAQKPIGVVHASIGAGYDYADDVGGIPAITAAVSDYLTLPIGQTNWSGPAGPSPEALQKRRAKAKARKQAKAAARRRQR